jgi:hypothetical protein
VAVELVGDPVYAARAEELREVVAAQPRYVRWCVLTEDTRYVEPDLRWCVFGPFGREKVVDAGASLASTYAERPWMVVRVVPSSSSVPS